MSYRIKGLYRDKMNLENLLKFHGVGVGKTFLLSWTFADNITRKQLAAYYWNKALTMVRSCRYRRKIVGDNEALLSAKFEFICVWERQKRGSWHLHLVGTIKGWSNTKLRQLLDLIMSVSDTSFGFYHLIWTKGNPSKVANYLAKYLVKFRERGIRIVSYSRNAVRVVKGSFSFIGGSAERWRDKCSEIYRIFPSFKGFYRSAPYDDKLRAVDAFREGRFRDFINVLLKHSNRFLVHSEWEKFRSKTLFECI